MAPLTIGGLARLAGVGVETIRYYQRLRLLPVPNAGASFRRYPQHVARRIRFIKKAQGVGFTLEEIGTLLDLADGRNRRAVQGIAAARLAQINGKLADLARMQVVLADLLHQCFTTGATRPCPIIESLTEGEAVLARP
ncbi:MAG: MerR family DNA-binding protein [Rubrivivax sp.]|nr:MerR family DNA-binding protein [Rubrivivax sp.]